METLRDSILSMIHASDDEIEQFQSKCMIRSYKKNEIVHAAGTIVNEVLLLVSGAIRVVLTDREGVEHSLHFSFENDYVTDYASFLLRKPGIYTLQALEKTEVIVLPSEAIKWAYANMKEGKKMGRLIAENYFIYHDSRVSNMYGLSPFERYEKMTLTFRDIHNRVPQHMIASYLGITPVHLSRLKKANSKN